MRALADEAPFIRLLEPGEDRDLDESMQATLRFLRGGRLRSRPGGTGVGGQPTRGRGVAPRGLDPARRRAPHGGRGPGGVGPGGHGSAARRHGDLSPRGLGQQHPRRSAHRAHARLRLPLPDDGRDLRGDGRPAGVVRRRSGPCRRGGAQGGGEGPRRSPERCSCRGIRPGRTARSWSARWSSSSSSRRNCSACRRRWSRASRISRSRNSPRWRPSRRWTASGSSWTR